MRRQVRVARRGQRIGERAEALASRNTGRAAGLQAELTRLTAPDQMGRLFKVLALTSTGAAAPPGVDGRI